MNPKGLWFIRGDAFFYSRKFRQTKQRPHTTSGAVVKGPPNLKQPEEKLSFGVEGWTGWGWPPALQPQGAGFRVGGGLGLELGGSEGAWLGWGWKALNRPKHPQPKHPESNWCLILPPIGLLT